MVYTDSNYTNFFKDIAERLISLNDFIKLSSTELLSAWNQSKLKGRILVLEKPDCRGTGIVNGNPMKKYFAAFSVAEACDLKDTEKVDELYDAFDEDIEQIIAFLLKNCGHKQIFRTIDNEIDIMPTQPLNNLKLAAKRCEFIFYTPFIFKIDPEKWL